MKNPTVRYRGEIKWAKQHGVWIAKFQGAELGRVIPDYQYPTMWRILSPGGRLSDMTNLSRARDAISAKTLSDGARQRSVR